MALREAFLILCILLSNLVLGQYTIVEDPYMQFDIYKTKNGLSNNRINDIFQDKTGFLWIATEKGLNRFDGYSFKTFLNNPKDSNSIGGDLISGIAQDASGNMWIANNSGLDFYNDKSNSFEHIYPFDSTITYRLDRFVRAIVVIGNYVWFDTANGVLFKYNTESKMYTSFKHQKPGQVFTYYYHQLFDDGKGNIWIGGRGIDPCSFNIETESFTYYKSNPNDKTCKRDKDVTKYYIDNRNTFWIAGTDGLYKFNINTKEFEKFIGGSTYDIIDLNDNQMWFSNGRGLKILNRNEEVIYSIKHSEESIQSLPSNYVFKLFKDSADNIWVGTLGGLCKYSPHKNKFKKVFHVYGDVKTISSNNVTSILQVEDNRIWIGTKNNGIDIVDGNFLKIDHLDNTAKSTYQLGANRISKLYQDSKGNIFVGLWAGVGFNVISSEKGINKLIRLNKETQKFDWFNDFIEDSNGRFWVGSWGTYGLGLFDNNNYKYVYKPKKPERFLPKLNLPFVSCLEEDSSSNLWVGTTNKGISIYNPETEEIQRFIGLRNDSTDITGSDVKCIFRDKNNNMWIGANGLNLYNRELNTFKHYKIADGLPDIGIQSILEDDQNNLWIATLNGLSKFDVRNDSFINYFEKDGLSGNEFTGAAAKLIDGRFVFGTKNGITVFNPDNITSSEFIPIVSIIGFKIFEESQDIRDIQDGEIELKYNRNYISFEFASSDYSDPSNNIFSYKLQGFDKTWQFTKGNINSVKYTYLEPRKYKLLIKTTNSDRVWSEKIKELNIIINPPFWKTWWFILLEIIFVLFLIFIFVKYRENKLKDKHFTELLEQRLLRSQMNPHFIFNALNAIQSYIFSHNPIEAATYLSKFADLMRSILYGSREEFVSLDEEIKTLKNYIEIQQIRFEDKFDFKFEIDDDINSDFIRVPPMLLQPFIENSIEHGFKNLNRKGLITIIVKKEDNKIKFEIEDNGMGIDKVQSQKTKVQSSKHKSMALNIVRERLRILNRDIIGKYDLRIENIIKNDRGIVGVRIVFFIPLENV